MTRELNVPEANFARYLCRREFLKDETQRSGHHHTRNGCPSCRAAIVALVDAPASSVPAGEATTACWLIERSQPEHQDPPCWWDGKDKCGDWVFDAHGARRFTSQAEAEGAFCPTCREDGRGHASEHVFFGGADDHCACVECSAFHEGMSSAPRNLWKAAEPAAPRVPPTPEVVEAAIEEFRKAVRACKDDSDNLTDDLAQVNIARSALLALIPTRETRDNG